MKTMAAGAALGGLGGGERMMASAEEQSVAASAEGAPGRRPNIILVMADQLAAASLGCYGSGVPSTPGLDALAARGVRFQRYYAHCPVCGPNRATMFTGRSIDVHGVITNNFEVTTDNPFLTQVLQHAGYRTGGFGKFHFTSMHGQLPESFAYLGFDETGVTEDPRWGIWLEWIRENHPEHYEQALATCWETNYVSNYASHPGAAPRDMREAFAAARTKHLLPAIEASGWKTIYSSPLPWELHQTTYITDRSLDFMSRHVRERPEQPFFCFTSYVDPHDPYEPPAPYDSMFDPADMPPPIPKAVEEYGPNALRMAEHNYLAFDQIAGNVEMERRMRALYHGSVKLIDDQVQRIAEFLDAHDLWDDTILLFTTDHGDMMGDHGFIAKGLMHYDKSARCPLIAVGGGIAEGVVSERLASSLDLYPTVCDLAGLDQQPPLEGRSLHGVCTGVGGGKPGWPEATVCMQSATSIITDDGWRLTYYDQPGQGQLFNLREDPREEHDLFHDPAYAAKRLELSERYARAYNAQRRTPRYETLPEVEGGRVNAIRRDSDEKPMPW